MDLSLFLECDFDFLLLDLELSLFLECDLDFLLLDLEFFLLLDLELFLCLECDLDYLPDLHSISLIGRIVFTSLVGIHQFGMTVLHLDVV